MRFNELLQFDVENQRNLKPSVSSLAPPPASDGYLFLLQGSSGALFKQVSVRLVDHASARELARVFVSHFASEVSVVHVFASGGAKYLCTCNLPY